MKIIHDLADLEERLSRPAEQTIKTFADVPGDVIVLGAGGKMGPTLCRMARRACDEADASSTARKIIGVSRFSDTAARSSLESAGVETIAGDLLDPDFLDGLPDCPNVIHMVGLKFGTSSAAGATWAINTFVPGIVFRKFRDSRIVSFSTGNVYAFTSPGSGGSRETDELEPVGEYGTSAMARERIIEYFSETLAIPAVILRLNYAVEMRYGVLIDLAQKVFTGQPVSLSTGYLNCIWQGDANELALRSLAHTSTPPKVFNLTGRETHSCRELCLRLGEVMGKSVKFCDEESETALLSNAHQTLETLGEPLLSIDDLLAQTADWVSRGETTLQRPTHFEVRDGKF